MSERQLKPGDEVWIRGRVKTVDPSNGDRLYGVTDECDRLSTSWPLPDDIRTADDFRDPLDDAIVNAATEWVEEFRGQPFGKRTPSTILNGRNILWAVEHKSELTKPRTPEEVATEAFDVTLPVAEAPKAIVRALRSAGLLREEQS